MARFKVPDRSVNVRWSGALDGLLPDDHLARFIWRVLCGIDFGELEQVYPSVRGGPGRSPYHPRLMAALWIFGMCQGIETAAGIAEACKLREDFQWLAGGLRPCDQTLLNFLTCAQDKLCSVWAQVLEAMQEAGLIDLSLVAEDGTKLRANASPRSFRTLEKIGTAISGLEEQLDTRLKQIAEMPAEQTDRKAAAEVAALRARLERAQRAQTELEGRIARRQARQPRGSGDAETGEKGAHRTEPVFDKSEFRHVPERNVLVCPADEELPFIGEYPTDSGHRSYRLYGRRNCDGCPLKERCTRGRGRRVKIPTEPPMETETSAPSREQDEDNDKSGHHDKDGKSSGESEPTASLTEPEAAWMLATSRKRWDPCFNADIAVTLDGIIVSQFLTNDCTDYHHFTPALAFVTTTLGKPESWLGDGHYGTEANLVHADREGVVLYAPRAGQPNKPTDTAPRPAQQQPRIREDGKHRFSRGDFRTHPDQDALLCPADKELRLMGQYPTDNRRGTYRLYGRRDCTGCPFKERCTRGRGRRVKIHGPPEASWPHSPAGLQDESVCDTQEDDVARVLREHESRMEKAGEELMKLRGHTSESANAHLKQHGLSRFHVRGMGRCGTVLTLACIAHNLMKWSARAAAHRLKLAA